MLAETTVLLGITLAVRSGAIGGLTLEGELHHDTA